MLLLYILFTNIFFIFLMLTNICFGKIFLLRESAKLFILILYCIYQWDLFFWSCRSLPDPIILQMLFSFILLSINLIIIWYCIFLLTLSFIYLLYLRLEAVIIGISFIHSFTSPTSPSCWIIYRINVRAETLSAWYLQVSYVRSSFRWWSPGPLLTALCSTKSKRINICFGLLGKLQI